MSTKPRPETRAQAARWTQKLPNGRLRCDLCPRHCQLKLGQRGFCFVREAAEESIVLNSYGRASGFCVDPIEKKPLNHFFPGSAVLSFGTAGCNLGCRFCQNWHISKAREQDKLTDSASPEAVVQAAKSAGCRSIAFTYNDPVIFAEYAIDCASEAKRQGLSSVAVSAGYITQKARPDFFKHLDAANIDLKAFSETFYRQQCYGALQPVLETLKWIHQETATWLEVTTLLIEGLNTSDAELDQMFGWYMDHLGGDVPLHLTAFHPDFKLNKIPRTPLSTLLRARGRARAAGIRFVYTGNVHSPETQSTLCPQCHALLIERNQYQLGEWKLQVSPPTRGSCAACHASIPGHFSPEPENWGNRRLRLPTLH